jgi:hypothetical protein
MGLIVALVMLAVVAAVIIGLIHRFGGAVLDALPLDGTSKFEFQGETFIWVPDGDAVGLFDEPYAQGSFQYADGTPVTDLMSVKLLQQHWVARKRRERDMVNCGD